ncbi:hypothetical protein FACS1894102_5290 [Spirochaetia bacterium]|nr:hypothetical protein FACS1894102_5290 [Spirochaetia bacterium]
MKGISKTSSVVILSKTLAVTLLCAVPLFFTTCAPGEVPLKTVSIINQYDLLPFSPSGSGEDSAIYGNPRYRINEENISIQNAYRTSDGVDHIILRGKIQLYKGVDRVHTGIPVGLILNESDGVYDGRGDFNEDWGGSFYGKPAVADVVLKNNGTAEVTIAAGVYSYTDGSKTFLLRQENDLVLAVAANSPTLTAVATEVGDVVDGTWDSSTTAPVLLERITPRLPVGVDIEITVTTLNKGSYGKSKPQPTGDAFTWIFTDGVGLDLDPTQFTFEWLWKGPYTAVTLAGLLRDDKYTQIKEINEALLLYNEDHRRAFYPEFTTIFPAKNITYRETKPNYNPNQFPPTPPPSIVDGKMRGGYPFLISDGVDPSERYVTFEIKSANIISASYYAGDDADGNPFVYDLKNDLKIEWDDAGESIKVVMKDSPPIGFQDVYYFDLEFKLTEPYRYKAPDANGNLSEFYIDTLKVIYNM